jgi:hypothetical protein
MNASPIDALISSLLPSLIVGLLLLVFEKQILHYVRDVPVNRFWESRWLALLERKLLLEELHDKTYHLVLWFVRTTMTGIVFCSIFFFGVALYGMHEHFPLHVTRWFFISVFIIACSTLPTLYRLSAYESTMERLNRKMDEYAARIPSWSE